jgi:hypothetical protein
MRNTIGDIYYNEKKLGNAPIEKCYTSLRLHDMEMSMSKERSFLGRNRQRGRRGV